MHTHKTLEQNHHFEQLNQSKSRDFEQSSKETYKMNQFFFRKFVEVKSKLRYEHNRKRTLSGWNEHTSVLVHAAHQTSNWNLGVQLIIVLMSFYTNNRKKAFVRDKNTSSVNSITQWWTNEIYSFVSASLSARYWCCCFFHIRFMCLCVQQLVFFCRFVYEPYVYSA